MQHLSMKTDTLSSANMLKSYIKWEEGGKENKTSASKIKFK